MSEISIRAMRADDPAEVRRVGELTLAAYDAAGDRFEGGYRDWLADPSQRVGLATDVLVAVDDVTGDVLGTVTFVLPSDAEFEHPPTEGAAGAHRIVIASMSYMTRAHGMYRRRGFVRRPDLDVIFPGDAPGWVFTLDLTDEAEARFGPPGPPREPIWWEDAWGVPRE